MFDLPDDDPTEANVRFAPGLSDAMFAGDESPEMAILTERLMSYVEDFADTGDEIKSREFHALLVAHPEAIAGIDDFLGIFIENEFFEKPYIYDLAYDLVTKSAYRQCVKFGIGMLGLCENKKALKTLKNIALHDEFTIFSVVAVQHLQGEEREAIVQDIWEMARNVSGWGRIQAIGRLVQQPLTDEIKNWLIDEGYQNNIMPEYTAFDCALYGDLHLRLAAPSIDRRLFAAAGEMLSAMLNEDVSDGMSQYVFAGDAISEYIRHAEVHAEEPFDYYCLYNLNTFLEELQDKVNEHSMNGWNQNLISNCLIEIYQILHRPVWREKALAGLESNDSKVFFYSKYLADQLNLDIWEQLWRRVQAQPENGNNWYHLAQYHTADRSAEIIDFAIKALPLKELAAGPDDLLPFGPDFGKYLALESVTLFLKNYPGQGEELIVASLRCPATRNRNIALTVLEAWGAEHWSEQIRQELKALIKVEPNENTLEKLSTMVDGLNV